MLKFLINNWISFKILTCEDLGTDAPGPTAKALDILLVVGAFPIKIPGAVTAD